MQWLVVSDDDDLDTNDTSDTDDTSGTDDNLVKASLAL